ncbi:MAG: DUF445 domain-containing protein, partial [Actinomycetota bacterium]|nr:DUF445 domain-containing protein [Actinomycetota bacterium]
AVRDGAAPSPPLSMTTPLAQVPALLEGDPAALRRMKRTATGLLVLAALVFLATFALPDSTATGFLRAAAEAAMVGGVADWFAVTALFRHPLGLRIPHTALIPRKKDELATKLGEFVTGNFLTPDVVAAQVVEARLVRRLAERLAEPDAAAVVGRELAAGIAALLDALDERVLTDAVLALVRRDLDRRSYTPVLGQFLARAIEGKGQRPLVDVGVTRLHAYVRKNRDDLHPQLKKFVEDQGVVGWLAATDKRVARLLDVVIAKLAEVEADPDHPLRRWVDGLLESLADDLRYNADTARAVDAQLRALVDDPHLQSLLHALLQDILTSVRLSLDELDGGLQQRIADLVRNAGARVVADADLERRLDARLLQAVRYAVEHYGDTVVSLIQKTVAQWEARDASSRIEAAVGRDLQFIRINGTVVGGLAGVLIHAVSVALG